MVIVKNTHIVKPAESTPNEIMYLSDCDQVKPLTHAPTIYIYKPTTPDSVKDAVPILKDSLSKILVIFYPVAGRLKWIGGGRVELHCNSKGVFLVEAESDLRIDDLGDFRPNSEIRELLPSVDEYDTTTPIEEVPLLLVQLTKLACGGLTLGVKLSHVLADGRSAVHFLSDWAKLARGEKSTEQLPFMDRKVLQPKEPTPTLNCSYFLPLPLLIGHPDNKEEKEKATTVTLLKIGKEQIHKLKVKANESIEIDELKSFRAFSGYEAFTAHFWRCASKARGHTSDQQTRCFVSVDFRSRLKPPLPPNYFGNAVLAIPAASTVGDLLSKPLGYASGKIREAIESVTDEYVSSYLVCSRNLPDVSLHRHSHTVGCSRGAFFGNPNLLVTSWSGLNLYGLDFGWGKEIYMGPAGLGYDGRVFFIPNHEGDGSFLIPLRMQVEHLDTFVKYFYEEI